MSIVRTALFRLIGVALLVALAAGTVWYTVVVPRQRQERFHAAPNPTPTATDATATSVPPPLAEVVAGADGARATAASPVSPASPVSSPTGTVFDFVVKVGACYETHAAASSQADVTPQNRSCDGPHNTEGVGAYSLREPVGASWDQAEVVEEANGLCRASQDAFIAGRDGFTEVVVFPGQEAWGEGDRGVGCLVRRDAGDVSGSLGR